MKDREDLAAVDAEPTCGVDRSDRVRRARALIRAAIEPLSPNDRMLVLARTMMESATTASEIAPPPHIATRTPEALLGSPGLTERQARILDWIESYIERTGFPPTLREIGTAFGIASTNGVNDHLRALERKGYIARADAALSRGLRVLRRAG